MQGKPGTPFHPVDVLRDHDVDVVVVDGHGVAFHGYPRATEDVDIVSRRTPANEQALVNAPTSVNGR